MTISRLALFLIAAAMVVTSTWSASATDLPLPPIHKAAKVAKVKKSPRHGPVRIAAAGGWPLGLVCGRGCATFPLVLGVAY